MVVDTEIQHVCVETGSSMVPRIMELAVVGYGKNLQPHRLTGLITSVTAGTEASPHCPMPEGCVAFADSLAAKTFDSCRCAAGSQVAVGLFA